MIVDEVYRFKLSVLFSLIVSEILVENDEKKYLRTFSSF